MTEIRQLRNGALTPLVIALIYVRVKPVQTPFRGIPQ